MIKITEQDYYEGVEVDLIFKDKGPMFGDLFTICGYENPNFSPPHDYNFQIFEALQFSQVDDYFGIETLSGDGDDVAVWLYPLINGQVVDHHPGPFDGLRLSYNVLRNPIHRSEHYFKVLETLSDDLPVTFNSSIENIKEKISLINEYWIERGITPGSSKALELDY